jgi:hypothetical protein
MKDRAKGRSNFLIQEASKSLKIASKRNPNNKNNEIFRSIIIGHLILYLFSAPIKYQML